MLTRKRFFQLVAVAAAASLVHPKRGLANIQTDNPTPFSPDIALSLANSLSESAAETELVADNPLPVLLPSGDQTGWLVTYLKGATPSGYVVFDVREEELVSSYSFSSQLIQAINAGDPSASSSKTVSPSQRDIVMFSPLDLGVKTSNNTISLFKDTREIDLSHSPKANRAPTTWDNLMIPGNLLFGNPYTVYSSGDLGDFWFVSESETRAHTGKYACAVTALYTIAGLTQMGNRFILDTFSDWAEYDKIGEYTNTKWETDAHGRVNGSTSRPNIGPGFTEYCKSKGYTVPNWRISSPSFARYQTQIQNGHHSVFSASIALPDGTESSHAMAVEGYRIIGTSSSSKFNCLFVYDGWSDMVSLNVSSGNYLSTYGTFF